MLLSNKNATSLRCVKIHPGRAFFSWAFLMVCLSGYAQPVPKLDSVSPDWLRRGSTVEVTFTGENLRGVTNLIFSGDAGLTGALSASPKPVVNVETSQGGISTT